MTRSFLFLQGARSPFFSMLGLRLISHGQRVSRINFNMGDAMQWRAGGAASWRKPPELLSDFYQAYYAQHGITDLVLFGDQRPVHRPAIEQAARLGIRTHVYEEGYFRPFWMTLERDGVNAHSRLPRDPDWYREAGKKVPCYRNGQEFASSFAARAWHDVSYQLCNLASRWHYPHYQSHTPVSAWSEYRAYVQRGLRMTYRRPIDSRAIARLLRQGRRFYLLPLQLDSDAQIRCHSRFSSMSELMAYVMASFALHAPADAFLVIKNHPLDPGLVRHERAALALAQSFDMVDRLVFLESGHLPALLRHATGVVTVNSTVGGSALWHARPLIALGSAIYGMAGLTHQGGLDTFWREHDVPDMSLFHQFRNVVIHATQINGGFYTQEGMRMAVEHSLPRLMAMRAPMEALQ